MTKASVKPALQRIEQGISKIQEKLCEIKPCETKEDVAAETGEEE